VISPTCRGPTRAGDGKPINVFDASGTGRFNSDSGGLAINYTHYGKKPDETLKIDANLERSSNRNTSRNDNSYIVSNVAANTGTRVEANDAHNHERKASLHTEYNTPVGDDQLTLGGEINADDKRADSRAFGPDALGGPLTLNPLLTDDFHSHQLVSALYGTYQRELTARWTVLAGVRGEATDLTSDDLTYHVQGKANYLRLNPSLFATYVLTKTQKLRFSYSHRQSLPDASDLNPHVVYSSDTSVNAGNPGLKPQETDALEARYEYDGKSGNYALRGFFNRDYRTIVPVSRVIPDPQNAGNFVTETMHVNWRQRTADGVTASGSKQIAGRLMLNADATVTFNEIRNPLVAGVQSGTAVDGSVSLNYSMKKGDQLFLMYKLTGRQFTGQGYTTGSGWGTLQYNHKLTSKLDLTMSVSDPFRQTKTQTVIDTPLLHSRYVNSQQAPTFMIGISRRFSHFGPMPAAGKAQ
jgi:outer membrane receptor protein involved in Fe transport